MVLKVFGMSCEASTSYVMCLIYWMFLPNAD